MLYVVIELLAVARRANLKELTSWCILTGLAAGFATDAILIAAGAPSSPPWALVSAHRPLPRRRPAPRPPGRPGPGVAPMVR